MKFFLLTFLIGICCFSRGYSQKNQAYRTIDNLLTSTQWDAMFPRRAGTYGTHPQGYNTDFYSFANFKQAIQELSDYRVHIRKKPNVWGELITITRISTNYTYNYSDVDVSWHNNTTPEITININFADFVNTASEINNKRELAAFLANISKETTGGWQPIGSGLDGDYTLWGLYFVHELGYTSSNCNNAYTSPHTEYPPTPNKCYYGRGPIQLSWNYNYGQFSKFLYEDKNVLLNNPDAIQQDGVLAFKSAIWFWMMPQWPKPSCHQVMHDKWLPQNGEYVANKMYKKGFAHTNNIINGGLECRNTSSAAFTQKVVLRSQLYKYYLGILGFSPTQINNEDSGDYTTLCHEGASNAMENYKSAYVIADAPLAIKLGSFKTQLKSKYVELLWTVYSSNIDYIEIEKSDTYLSNFQTIAKINHQPVHEYIYHDFQVRECYYRLKIVERDGNIIYSKPIYFTPYPEKTSLEVYPNPVSDFVWIKNLENHEKISIYDVWGKALYKNIAYDMENGFSVAHFPTGTYYLHIQTRESYKILKFIKM